MIFQTILSLFAVLVGGSLAQTALDPISWYVYLLIEKSDGSLGDCFGSLIHGDMVLTAASCIPDDDSSVTAIFGVTDEGTTTGNEFRVGVVDTYRHPDFVASNFRNDIMLLKLDPLLAYSQESTIEYNTESNFPAETDELRVVGTILGPLQEATLSGVASETCIGQYASTPAPVNPLQHICAFIPDLDDCVGDGGAPLLLGDIQVGVQSYRRGPCGNAFAQVYTRVSSYKDWMEKIICDFAESPPQSCLGLPAFCFSGRATVETKDRGIIRMQNLQIGDFVRVSKSAFEPVYSFGHHDPDRSANFLKIESNSGDALEISAEHMVFVKNHGAFLQASRVQVGDSLLASTGAENIVVSITTVTRRGIFAPFTPSGTIIVGGVLASNYISMISESSSVGSFHHIVHTLLFPYRVVCHYFNAKGCKAYGSSGIATFLEKPFEVAGWMVEYRFIQHLLAVTDAMRSLRSFELLSWCWMTSLFLILFCVWLERGHRSFLCFNFMKDVTVQA